MHVRRIKLDKRSPDHLPIDGVNVWGTLLGQEREHPRKDLLYWHGSDGFEVGDSFRRPEAVPDRCRAS